MFSISNLSIHYTGDYIFKKVSFLINDRDRIGLVGKNGAGKSTLLKILAGELEQESGDIASPDGNTVGYLPQELELNSDTTVFKETLKAFDELKQLEIQIQKITDEIAERTDYESESYLKLIERLNDSNDQFQFRGGHSIEGDTEKVLIGLGFLPSDFTRMVKEFSGGWQMRIVLAKILLQKPNLLLLDEPTNHLDIISIQWLEQYLKFYSGAVMMVSHDKAFLDNVTNRTIEISLGKIYDFNTSYSEYVQRRKDIRLSQIAAYENQQKEIEEIERFITRFRYQATKATQVQSRVKKLEKMDRIQIDDSDNSSIHFRFPPAPRSGKIVYEAKSITKRFGDKLILDSLDFVVERGDFVAFVGKNGEGKTTLSKVILEQFEYEGEGILGHNVKIGYYAQNQAEFLDGTKTVFETIDDVATGEMRTKVKGLLGSFLFRADDLDKKVCVLSGGEKARLALAKLLLDPVNLLILDEPTNHLDMLSKDILKEALLQFGGTLIVVSHDRDFLDGLTNRILEVKNHKLKTFYGGIYEFLEKNRIESLDDLTLRQKSGSPKKEKKNSTNKQAYIDNKQVEKERRKIRKKIESCENQIEKFEEEIEQMDVMLANPDKNAARINSGDFYKEYDDKKLQLEKTMEEWESHQLELDEIVE
ncbi:MAG: ABC-F family ATP-binding cassette domain-containing protein [Bacteroidota bacterium]|nr:ABC-F family ATP-binding cassette domain-containing protein [Bacteroidota bacterium]